MTSEASPFPGVDVSRPRTREHVDITTGEVRTIWNVPSEMQFYGRQFLEDERLDQLFEEVMAKHRARFGFLEKFSIAVIWKAEGGEKGGNATLGKCTKPSGLAAHYSGRDFVIWLAADHLGAMLAGEYEMEVLLFHELLHCGETSKGEPTLNGHSCEAFSAEVAVYGPWQRSLKSLDAAFRHWTRTNNVESEDGA